MKQRDILIFLSLFFLSLLPVHSQGLQLGVTQYFDDSGDFDIRVTPGENSITISLPTMEVHEFVIYRSTSENGAYKKEKNTKTTTFIDTKVTKGVTYYYVAVAVIKTDKKGKDQWEKLRSRKAYGSIVQVISDVNVSFNSTPRGAIVIINNENIGATPVSKKFKLGTYQLSMQKEGYKTYKDFNFVVDYKPNINVNVTLEEIKSALNVSTTPAGATIMLDDRVIGTSPLFKDKLALGKHKIKATLKGYRPIEEYIVLSSEAHHSLSYMFEQEIKQGNLYIDSTPQAAEILIDNKRYGVTPLQVKNLLAGGHQLILKKNGYNELNNLIEVEQDTTKTYRFTLVKEHGFLSITTSPDKAECFINDRSIGLTPVISCQVDKGSYNLVIRKDNYDEYKELITVNVGDHIKRDLLLSLKKATLIVNTYPDKANIYIQGNNYGITPFISDNIQPGQMNIEIQKSGYNTVKDVIDLDPGEKEEMSYTLELTPLPPPPPTETSILPVTPVEIETPPVVIKNGTLSVITTPSASDVYLNNKNYGQTPLILSLPPDTYNVTISKNNYQTYNAVASIQSEDTQQINVNLISLETWLNINSNPIGADIYLNNALYGQTHHRFKVAAGDYVLTLKKTGYDPFSTTLNISGTEKEIIRSYTLAKERKTFYFDSSPQESEVLMNNRVIGVTPFQYYDITDGLYNFIFRKTGYRDWQQQVSIAGGNPSRIQATLQALKGELVVNTIPGSCDVYLDNKNIGASGRVFKDIAAGYHKILLKKYGYYDVSGNIRIFDQQTSTYSFQLAEKPKGNIKVDSNPREADVYLNGRQSGLTPALLQDLPEDKYSLRIKKSGYKSYYANVNVQGNRTEYINAQLIKGSDCCVGGTFLTKPVFWYILSGVCLVGAGYAYYEEEKALKDGDGPRRHNMLLTRNALLIGSGSCLLLGVTFSFFDL